MGYLSVGSSTIPNFKKAVISLWFRVPQASIDACIAAAPDVQTMNFVIPLVTFGRPQQITNFVGTEVKVNTYIFGAVFNAGDDPPEFDTPTYSAGEIIPAAPSYIGIVCNSSDHTAGLAINLQTDASATLSGFQYNRDSTVVWGGDRLDPLPVPDDPFATGNGWTGNSEVAFETTEVDTSGYLAASQPGVFHILPFPTIVPDQWSHALLSFDITNGCATAGTEGDVDSGVLSYSKMWFALDDVNYDGNNLGAFGGSDPNMLLTDLGNAAINRPASVDGFNCANGPAEYSLTGCVIPSSGGPFGIPASATFVDNIFKVEMAEFQMFTGVSMDTSVAANRRAFIARGADGSLTPVNPFAIGALSDPTDGVDPHTLIAPGKPHKLLGKPADIVLSSTSRNWIGGINTGTSKDKLKATGTIKAFLPNPKVGS